MQKAAFSVAQRCFSSVDSATGVERGAVAQATVCAKFGLPCIIYMGAKDMERQALNVFRMRLLGAEVRSVHIVDYTACNMHVNCCLRVPLLHHQG